MKSSVLANFDMTWLPLTALILFVAVFASMLLMVFRKGSSEIYQEAEQLPLTNGGNQNE